MMLGVGVPGEAGLNVTCWPAASTAVHWLVEGHATLVVTTVARSIVVEVASAADAGSNVNSRPVPYVLDSGALARGGTRDSVEIVPGINNGTVRGRRHGRIERDLQPTLAHGRALAHRRTCQAPERTDANRNPSRGAWRRWIECHLRAIADDRALAHRRTRHESGARRRLPAA